MKKKQSKQRRTIIPVNKSSAGKNKRKPKEPTHFVWERGRSKYHD